MEVRHYEQILGGVTTAAVVEGRMGILKANTFTEGFGSDSDLPGFAVPANTTEAKNARYIVAWPVDNRQFPNVLSQTSFGYPGYTYDNHYGFGQTANFDAASLTFYGVNPANQECLTIPQHYKVLLFKGGIFTFPSGCGYIYNSALETPGTNVRVQDATTDATAGEAGKLKYSGSATYDADTDVGHVLEYHAATGRLTVIIDE